MRKGWPWWLGLVFCLVLAVTPTAYAQTAPPEIGAISGILIDIDSGTVLWEKNSQEPLPPASTTKVMTGLLTASLAAPEEIFTASPQAAAVGEASAHLVNGERLAMADMLAAALITSANDACYALGENIAGKESIFVRWMNEKAVALGGANTNFCNTNGLPATGHVMSVADLARYARVALTKPIFARLVDTSVTYTETGSYRRYLKTTNRLLFSNPEVDGVKTGTTDAAGACLVASMSREGRHVLAVVFKSPNRFGEALDLLNYGVDSFKNIYFADSGAVWGFWQDTSIIAEGEGIATVEKETNDLNVKVEWRQTEKLPAAGETVAWLVLEKNGSNCACVNLIAKDDVKKQGIEGFLEKIRSCFEKL